MSSETVDWHGRPAQLCRAVYIRFMDGGSPAESFLVLDDDAPPGGRRVEYVVLATDDTPWEIRAWHEGDSDWSEPWLALDEPEEP